MASIQSRTSRGKKYWSIVECRRINGKPRTVIIEYLGTAETLLERIQKHDNGVIKSYSHGDTTALLNIANEMNLVDIIDTNLPEDSRHMRDGLTVGTSLLLAAIGRACCMTSKRGWYDWCKGTSLEHRLKLSLKNLDSQHFWDQMHALPEDSIDKIEEAIVKKLLALYQPDLRELFFDTTNFFTFIDSTNQRCSIAKRGKNKQKRTDLRQVGLALVVSKHEQFPVFHKTYDGNKNDITVFKETIGSLLCRLRAISVEVANITLIFDKGNNSKHNFALLDAEESLYFIGSLAPSHFKEIIQEANKKLSTIKINDGEVLAFKTTKAIWGKERTCVVFVSDLLKDGQINGILQHLDSKYKKLANFQRILKGKKTFTIDEIKKRLDSIVRGQFVTDILKYEIKSSTEFVYYCDFNAFSDLKESVLGRQFLVTNRGDWSAEEIITAYQSKTKVEYSFRTLKNPYHLAVRPQYHWTDQKIKVHAFICIIAYLLSFVVFRKAKDRAQYPHDIDALLDDLRSIRLASVFKGRKVSYQLEKIPEHLTQLASVLNVD